MAVCEIWDVRGRLDHPIDYAENPEKTANPKYTEADLQAMVDVMEYATNKNKTEQRFFVTGVNCDPTTARDEMMITKAGWNDMSEIVCYHGFQSFKHGEVTPEQAHEVGVKLAERMWGDRFQVIVATHLNTDCLHNHFVVNSVSFADGMHYHDNKANLRLLRQRSAALRPCRQSESGAARCRCVRLMIQCPHPRESPSRCSRTADASAASCRGCCSPACSPQCLSSGDTRCKIRRR